jgi:hypothetical protein
MPPLTDPKAEQEILSRCKPWHKLNIASASTAIWSASASTPCRQLAASDDENKGQQLQPIMNMLDPGLGSDQCTGGGNRSFW